MSRLCLLLIISCVIYFAAGKDVSSEAYSEHKIIPDVLTVAPKGYLTVEYLSGVEVQEGNVLSPVDLQAIPSVRWDQEDKLYTIVMVDPDVPSRESPTLREFVLWLVVDVRGSKNGEGFDESSTSHDSIVEYIGPSPRENSGLHRYVFLVYQQNQALEIDEPTFNRLSTSYSKFSIKDFAKKYNLGDPIAGNFYQAEFDPDLDKDFEVEGEYGENGES